MSLEKVQKVVEEFLLGESPEVLSIKGGWGVGKTFFWNSFVKEASKNQKYIFQRYAYVSLFGISSLDELKFGIFEQTINKSQIGKSISIENLKQNAKDLAERLGRKASWLLQTIPWLKNIGSAIHSAAFLSVKDMLICLDDFERKGDRLSAKDVFGMILLLKEQRNCKVVLIFNDSNLDEKAKQEYRQFREKVIDVEVTYNPTAKECASLVFSDNSDIHKHLSGLSIKLDIRNIRILRKIERAARDIERVLIPFESEVLYGSLQTLMLLGWCYYSDDNELKPSYEYVKTRHELYALGDKDKPELEKKWDAILRDYGFGYVDELDLALASVIETGYIDENNFIEEAKKFNAKLIAQKSRNSFGGAWDLFHYSFKDNKDELIGALERGVKENAEYISPNELNGTVGLLRDLGKGNLASELIDVYIEKNKDKSRLFNLNEYGSISKIDDRELISKFNSKFNETRQIRTLEDVIRHIAERDGWGGSDEEILSAATEEDFYKIFKMKEGKDLSAYVDVCLQFGRFVDATEQQKAIAEKAKNALMKIGQESNLNRIRVRKYGISIDNNS